MRILGTANSSRNYPAEAAHILNMTISAFVFFWSLVNIDPFEDREWKFECIAPADYADRSEEAFGIFDPDLETAEDTEVRQAREQQEYSAYQEAVKNAEAPNTLVQQFGLEVYYNLFAFAMLMNWINANATDALKWRKLDEAVYLTWKRPLQLTLASFGVGMHLNYFYWFMSSPSFGLLRIFNFIQASLEIGSGALIATKIRSAAANSTNETWIAMIV